MRLDRTGGILEPYWTWAITSKTGGNVKIESAFCDVHSNEKLALGTVDLGRRYGLEQQQTLRCKHEKCGRHFHYDFGYFPVTEGAELDTGVLDGKPKCRKGHDLLYMLLTRVEGVLMYACFHPECTTTLPYEAAAEDHKTA